MSERSSGPALLRATCGLVLGALLVGAPCAGTANARDPQPDGAPPALVKVPKALFQADDGDTFSVLWPDGVEVVRILGIDTPETEHREHDVLFTQPFGEAASGFLEGCVATADRLEIRRAPTKDPYGRTLAYLYVDGKNYSVLVVRAHLAVETVHRYGDNGFPDEAAVVLAAAKAAGPVPFEDPARYRTRMRELAAWRRRQGAPAETGGAGPPAGR